MSVEKSNGVSYSNGIYNSEGVSYSNGIYNSEGVSYSNGVYNSLGVSYSYGVYTSLGVSYSYGVYNSSGVYNSNGVSYSNGVSCSNSVYNSLFVSGIKNEPILFNKKVTNERIAEVRNKYNKLANGWIPKFNNAFELYEKQGKDWKKVDASQIKSVDKVKAYADMPKDLIKYLMSLPEFDKQVFLDVTGIDVDKDFSKVKVIIEGKEILLDRGCVEKIMELLK